MGRLGAHAQIDRDSPAHAGVCVLVGSPDTCPVMKTSRWHEKRPPFGLA
jgi:hypothetical protein